MYRPPRDCPVCAGHLHITELGCPDCGTGLSGNFEPCEFCALDHADRDVLRVFLASRGNMKEVERHLGVSYPTARLRFDELLTRLGLVPGADPTPASDAGSRSGATTPSSSTSPSTSPSSDPRLATLQSLAAGEVDVTTARDALAPAATSAPPATKARGARKKR